MTTDEIMVIFWRFVAVAILVLINGFFVAAEFALVKIRDTQLQPLINRGHRRARIARHVLNNLDRSLSAAQLAGSKAPPIISPRRGKMPIPGASRMDPISTAVATSKPGASLGRIGFASRRHLSCGPISIRAARTNASGLASLHRAILKNLRRQISA